MPSLFSNMSQLYMTEFSPLVSLQFFSISKTNKKRKNFWLECCFPFSMNWHRRLKSEPLEKKKQFDLRLHEVSFQSPDPLFMLNPCFDVCFVSGMHFVIFFMTLNDPVLILLFWVRYSKYFFPRKHFHSPNHKSVIKLKLLSTSLSTHIKLSTSSRLWDKGNLITFFAKLLLSTLHHSTSYNTESKTRKNPCIHRSFWKNRISY